MSELINKLSELPTFQLLSEVETAFMDAETPKNFDPNNLEHLAEQAERIKKREGLDHSMAINAFRLEVATSTSSLLTMTERLATIAAYDPVVMQRHNDNDRQVSSSMNPSGKVGVRKHFAQQELSEAHLLGAEGWGVPRPSRNATHLVERIAKARDFAEIYEGEVVGIKLPDGNALTGVLPSTEVSFALSEPVVTNNGVEYTIPSSFDGIYDLRLLTKQGERKLSIGNYPQLITESNGELTANPQLSRLRQELGLLGVNIHRSFYLNDFSDSIVPEAKGLHSVLPAPERVRRRPVRLTPRRMR